MRLKENFISGVEFLLVAIVDPRPSNSCHSSCYSRKSHLITGRKLDGKWDPLPNANYSASEDDGSSTSAIWIIPHSHPASSQFTCPLSPYPYTMTKRPVVCDCRFLSLLDDSSDERWLGKAASTVRTLHSSPQLILTLPQRQCVPIVHRGASLAQGRKWGDNTVHAELYGRAQCTENAELGGVNGYGGTNEIGLAW